VKYILKRKMQFILACMGTFCLTYLLYLDDPSFMDFGENILIKVMQHILVLPIFFWLILITSNRWSYEKFGSTLSQQMSYEKYNKFITLYMIILVGILLFALRYRGIEA